MPKRSSLLYQNKTWIHKSKNKKCSVQTALAYSIQTKLMLQKSQNKSFFCPNALAYCVKEKLWQQKIKSCNAQTL